MTGQGQMSDEAENFRMVGPSFADALREILEAGAGKPHPNAPWTVKAFAARINVSDRIVRYWMRGHAVPRLRVVEDIIRSLNLDNDTAVRLREAHRDSRGEKELSGQVFDYHYRPSWRLLQKDLLHASFGRESEIALLERSVLGRFPARAMIYGAFGVGRTHTLVGLAARTEIQARFGGRIAYISLRGAPSGDMEISALSGIVDTDHLRDKPALLLIDDLDEPWRSERVQAASQLDQLATMLPAATIVATTRGSREAVERFPDAIALGPLAEAAAIDMMTELAPGIGQFIDLCWLVGRLNRMPLAIALAAEDARLDADGLREALALGSASVTRSLRWSQVIGSSVERALAAVRPREEATNLFAIMGSLGGPARWQDLEQLLDQGLIAGQALLAAGLACRLGDRVELVEPLRSVASVREPKMQRPWRFFLKRAVILGDRVGRKAGGDVAVQEFSADRANVETAILGGLRSGDTSDVQSALSGLGRFYQLEPPRTLDVLTEVVDEASKGGHAGVEAAARKVLGEVALNVEQVDLALAAFRRAKEIFDSLEDREGSAQVRLRLAEIAFRQYKNVEADAEFRDIAEFFGKRDDRGREAMARQRLGEIALRQGRIGDAEANFQDAYILYQRAYDAVGQSNCSQFLGNLALDRQNRCAKNDETAQLELAMAQLYFDAARRIAREVGDTLAIANAVFGLGRVLAYSDKNDAAISLWNEAKQYYIDAGDTLGQANCIRQCAMLEQKAGKLNEAIASLSDAFAMYDKIGRSRSAASCAATLARIYVARDDKTKAQEAYARARDRFIKVNDKAAASQIIEQLAKLASDEIERAALEKQAASMLEQATLDL